MNKVWSNKRAIFLFVAPALILFTVFVVYSAIRVGVGSFFNWDGITTGTFVGLKEFRKLFTSSVFYLSLKNGLISAGILLVTQLILGFFLAVLLSDKAMRGRKFFRTVFFLPVVLSVTVVCMLGLFVLAGDNGILNRLLAAVGINYQQYWLTNTKTSIYAISFVNGWQFMGLYICLFYSAIRSIPDQYFEAALMDGSNRLQTAWHVTMPMCIESVKYCLLFAMLGGLNQFAQNLIMTAGGPGGATYSLSLLMYMRAFGSNDYGLGSATAVVIVAQGLIVAIVINKALGNKTVVY